MRNILSELRRRNSPLYYFGWFNIFMAIVCIVMSQVDNTQVLGLNAWIKPLKFYLSVLIFTWTMAWIGSELKSQRKMKFYSWMVIIVFVFEHAVVTWQAANGRLSHFNIETPLYGMLYGFMGIAIVILVVWTAFMDYLFFRQKEFNAPMTYIWGIRLGLLFFIIFSFEGGMMSSNLSHTVGAADGGAGLPVVNWSTEYGDLRIAHFIGMHSLQILPLFGYYISKRNRTVILFSLVYFLFAAFLFLQAMRGIPLWKFGI